MDINLQKNNLKVSSTLLFSMMYQVAKILIKLHQCRLKIHTIITQNMYGWHINVNKHYHTFSHWPK